MKNEMVSKLDYIMQLGIYACLHFLSSVQRIRNTFVLLCALCLLVSSAVGHDHDSTPTPFFTPGYGAYAAGVKNAH